MTTVHQENPSYSLVSLCRALSVPRSTFYALPSKREEKPIRAAIEKTAGDWPRYGSRRVTAQMRRNGVIFDEKPLGERRVRRIMRELGLLNRKFPRKVRTTNSEHSFPRYENLVKDLTVTRADQVWVSDFTYIPFGSGFLYLAVVMDVWTRCIRGWSLSRGMEGELTLCALRMALVVGKPEIHHSDQGSQYAATEYVNLLEGKGVRVSMAAVGCPEENGYAERLMRTIKEEHTSLTQYADYADAKQQIGQFLSDVYQTKRVHSSLNYLTPAEFEQQNKEKTKPLSQ